ncbi:glycosylhydrolase-like jelly roll fold domain-containing protein [Amycolatopsis vastitatis]|uniref:glycosylhydrolase-like jelly roll fold domain-containing protein n=1 Tax=Amycolatopsis vastitatis TaxID=1905142 RepID=UPI00196A4ED3|nr:glycosylhydrolase-like jelly roll fold domain-containing protein [Amycolatopsis vastitatis]
MRRTLMSLVLAVVTALSVSTPATAGHDPGFDPAAFANPPKDSRPAIYWYWNNTITSAITDHQMAEMRAKGIYEAVIFPLGGDSMQPVFLSEDWFTLVGHVLREAQRTGMKMWLFNDNNFPSGRGANYVVNGGTLGARTIPARPDLRLKGLLRSTRIATGPSTLKLAETSGLSVDTGKLVVDPATAPGAAPLAPGAGWTDYTVSGKVTLTTGGVQLAVRSDGTHGYLVDVDQKGAASVYKVDGPNRTRLTTGVNTPGFTPTHVQTVSVTVSGTTITPKINNTVQPAATDASYPAGAAAVSAEGTQRSLWDDLTVTAADGAKLWTSTFDDATALADFSQNRVNLTGVTAAAARPVGTTAAVELTGDTWQVPAGRWQVDVYSQVLLRDDSSGYVRGYLDLLDPAATDAFLSIAPEEYARRFPWAMGSVVPGFWDDEPFLASAQPHPFKRLPSSPGLADAVRAAGGTPGVAYTAAADGLDAVADRAAGTYWRAVDNLFSTSYYRREADWMAKHGLKLISNPLLDEQGPQQRMNSTGDLAKDNQWAQVPGSDMITTDYTAGRQTTLARNASSAAHQSGAPRSLMETFGNAGWQVAPDYMHATVGALATRGVNLTFLHAMYTDETSVTFAPPFGPRSTFWEDMPDVDAWIGRVMELGRGTNLARSGLVQPQRAAEQTRKSDAGHRLDDDLSATAFALERGQVDFDLLSDSSLSGDPAARFQAVPRAGTLQVGRADYQLAVLPRTPVVDLETARTLTKFVQSGGHLIAVGPLPTREAAGRDADLARELRNLSGSSSWTRRGAGAVALVTDVNAIAGLAQNAGFGAARLQPAADAVRVQRTGRGADTAFLLNNESDAVVTTTVTFPVGGTPEIWDPRTGTAKVATAYSRGWATTGVPVTLQPYETLGVVFRQGVRDTAHLTDGTLPAGSVSLTGREMQAAVTAVASGTYALTGQANGRTYRGTVRVTDPLAPIALTGPWTVRLEQDGAVATERPLGSWTTFAPTFSGSAVYTTTVTLTAEDLAQRKLILDLGEVHDLATATVNGTELPTALWHPYTVDATKALRPGVNTISVRVTNTLANSRNKILPSGLVGPVALRPQAAVTARLEAIR